MTHPFTKAIVSNMPITDSSWLGEYLPGLIIVCECCEFWCPNLVSCNQVILRPNAVLHAPKLTRITPFDLCLQNGARIDAPLLTEIEGVVRLQTINGEYRTYTDKELNLGDKP